MEPWSSQIRPQAMISAIGVTLVAAALAAAVLTRVARRAALRLRIVSEPRADRWNKKPTPLLGGLAIALGAAVGFSITLVVFGFALGPAIKAGLSVLTSAALMLAVGVFDDVSPLRPQVKLLFQVVAAVVLVSFGAILPVTPWYVVNVVVTLFWFVGVTNARCRVGRPLLGSRLRPRRRVAACHRSMGPRWRCARISPLQLPSRIHFHG